MGNRKICISTDKDILRWGYSTTGTFTIKEAYQIQENFHNQEKDHIWHIIWKTKLWPKVSTFLWLLVQNRLLTWDNLRKEASLGPPFSTYATNRKKPWNISLINVKSVIRSGTKPQQS
jgi:hypothetical protein